MTHLMINGNVRFLIEQTEFMKKEDNYLSTGTVIEGKIIAHNPIRVDGTILGSIDGHDEVIFEPHGRIEGPVRAKIVTIKGQVDGDIFSNGKVMVLDGGRITGKVTTPQAGILVQQGGIVNSSFTILESSPQQILLGKNEAEKKK